MLGFPEPQAEVLEQMNRDRRLPLEQPPERLAVCEYQGEASIRVSATQLGTSYSAAAAGRIVDEWVNFLAAGPSPIRELAARGGTGVKHRARPGGRIRPAL